MTYKFKVYVGPVAVKQMADKFVEAGVKVVCIGTENLHVESEGSEREGAAWNILVDLYRKHGTDFGVRPRSL